MRSVLYCSVLGVLLLGGCGGGGAGGTRPVDNKEELPVTCLTRPDPGTCRGSQQKYFYDYRDNRCKSFSYGGCGGRVPFESLQDCLNYCGATP
jgi:hypothetical protein